MATRRIVVTGLGVVSPLGVHVAPVWSSLIAGQSGIISLASDPEYASIPSTVAGVVPKGPSSENKWDPSDWIRPASSIRRTPVFAQYALCAATQALADANWHPQKLGEKHQEATGVCIGSGIGSIEDLYDTAVLYNSKGYKKVSPLFVPKLLNNMAAGHVSIENGLKGPNHSVSSACTTGAHSIGDAMNFIKLGMADVMVAGSAEAAIHPISLAGFSRAKSLSTNFNDQPSKSSRPFDKDRCGFVMGEGSAVMVLEELDHALARKAPTIYAELVGYGLSGDSNHITAPPSDGNGAYRSMKMALKMANLKPTDIGYINAHATSTNLGDAAENKAIERLFVRSETVNEDFEPNHQYGDYSEVAVSSTKGAIGHLLGASGSIEALFTVMALHTGQLPPTLNADNIDVENENLRFNYVPNHTQPAPELQYALTNSFGFGGTNASLIFKKY
ncbi:hypothetical protein NADFUDRAFT_48595 [Nadsonia fulvescens var. elongata DSM 6958]|uniref:3-oxoacyl-[acyl-carrier-protein] synthase n=1 Tax=Nadsonia fulvescens var. elongata DSM 6958 TaxID=857566 RepID=A0A1E3PSZ5_9ASCO|nr:hypothetical protein NADFUDRAFT_48595 [Nadsonia fulvescens var. elongata DSM 6958]